MKVGESLHDVLRFTEVRGTTWNPVKVDGSRWKRLEVAGTL